MEALAGGVEIPGWVRWGEGKKLGGNSKCHEKLVESFKQGSDMIQFNGL